MGFASVLKLRKRISLLIIFVFIVGFSCKEDSSVVNDAGHSLLSHYLPDTGQTTSFTLTNGEDADFLIHPPSYTENGDGTITDNVTGLIWQKADGGEMTFESAGNYCKTLVLGGKIDWRLPTGHELFGINNFDRVNPALDINFFTKTSAEYWWSSDLRSDDTSYVWVVNAGGGIGAHPKTETVSAGGAKRFHVRAVRNPFRGTLPSFRFKDNNDGTITDNYTGLIWQKLPSATPLTWEESLGYAKGLSLVGKSDWRVPNVKELQSLNDETQMKPSLNKNYFPTILSGNFWSSTSQVNTPSRVWDLNVDYGIVSYSDKSNRENVLCVRGGVN